MNELGAKHYGHFTLEWYTHDNVRMPKEEQDTIIWASVLPVSWTV
jgi:hypothetical protein